MKKNLIFILPLFFLLFAIFNIPLFFPSIFLIDHYYAPFLSFIDIDFYYSILQKYKIITLFDGINNNTIKISKIHTKDEFKSYIESNLKSNNINFISFFNFLINDIKWYEKPLLIMPFYPQEEEIKYCKIIEKKTGIPIDFIIEKTNRNKIVSINTRYFLNEKKVKVDILLSKKINQFNDVILYKIAENKKVLILEKNVDDLIKNSNIFEFVYEYSDENSVNFEIQLKAQNIESYFFKIALTQDIDRKILFITNDNDKNFLDTLYNLEKINLEDLKNKNLNDYSLIIFDGIPLKRIDPNISSKLVDGFKKDNFGIFFVSESHEIGKTEDNPEIEPILPIELSPKSLKEDPKVSISLFLDVSSSMMGEKLSLAKISAYQMLTNLKPDDIISIYLFWDQFTKLFSFTKVKDVTGFFSFDKIEATGGTDMALCLEEGLKELSRYPSVNRHAIIISDFQTKPASWENILSIAIENDITISVIQIGSDINSNLAEKIAKTTGGNIYIANSFDMIPTILFEDRKRIARPPFLIQKYIISDSYDDIVSEIDGMNITTAKENAKIILKNQYNDPLFAFVKKGSKGVGVFLSDLKGNYTKNFLKQNYVKLLFNKYFDSQLANLLTKVSLTEISSGFSVVINSAVLINPHGILFFNGEKVYEKDLNRLALGYFEFSISTIQTGQYSLQIKDLGNTMLKMPINFNGLSNADNYNSIVFLAAYPKSLFKKYYSINFWLVLFFLSSILTTYFLRIFNNKR